MGRPYHPLTPACPLSPEPAESLEGWPFIGVVLAATSSKMTDLTARIAVARHPPWGERDRVRHSP